MNRIDRRRRLRPWADVAARLAWVEWRGGGAIVARVGKGKSPTRVAGVGCRIRLLPITTPKHEVRRLLQVQPLILEFALTFFFLSQVRRGAVARSVLLIEFSIGGQTGACASVRFCLLKGCKHAVLDWLSGVTSLFLRTYVMHLCVAQYLISLFHPLAISQLGSHSSEPPLGRWRI